MDSDAKSMKTPVFDGNMKSFHTWWTRFEAFARVQKFAEALGSQKEPDMPATEAETIDETDDAGKKAIRAKNRNARAVAHLTMAFTKQRDLKFVALGKDADWPGGLAYKIVRRLKQKYQPAYLLAQLDIKKMMDALNMKDDDDPSVLFEQIAEVQNRALTANMTISTKEEVAMVIKAAPPKYHAVITAEVRAKGVSVTGDDLEDVMTQFYRQITTTSSETRGIGTEVSLTTFSGKCHKCGEVGHKAMDCPNKEQNGGGGRKFKGKCNHCGKVGHREAQCWEKPENADKRPANYRGWAETGAAAAQTSDRNVEVVLTSIDVPYCSEILLPHLSVPPTLDLLYDRDIWIADSGASVHMTPYADGISELNKLKSPSQVEVGKKGAATTITAEEQAFFHAVFQNIWADIVS